MTFSRRSSAALCRADAGLVSFLICCLSLLFVCQTAEGQDRVGSIPAPSPQNSVIDHARVIQEFGKQQLEELCREIRGFKKSEMVILTVQDTGNVAPEDFAISYFNKHGIGEGSNNNGLLVFAAMRQRTAYIAMGEKLESAANRRLCQKIANDVMVARFKRNDPAGGMFGGGFAAAREILGYTDLANRLERETDAEHRLRKSRSPERKAFFLWLAGGGVLGVGGFMFLWSRYQVRYGKRDCKSCSSEMVMLDEQQDDSFLDPPERIEERLGSVDYDVWACMSCDEVTKYRYGKLLTRYSRCPDCRYKTRSKISRTIRAATRHRGGKVRVTETCENCSFHKTYTYSTPKLRKPSSGSSRIGKGGFSIGGSRRRSGGFGSGRSSRSSSRGSSRGGGGARW